MPGAQRNSRPFSQKQPADRRAARELMRTFRENHLNLIMDRRAVFARAIDVYRRTYFGISH